MFGLHFSRLGSVNILAPINRALSFISALSNSITPQRGSAATFTRSTTATVVDQDSVVRTAKINEARFPGLRRVENLFSFSEDFSNGAWTKTRATISPNSAIAPNGEWTADTLFEDATVNNSHDIRRTFTVDGTDYLVSIYGKPAGRQWVYFELQNYSAQTNRARAWFNLQTGAVGVGNTVGSGVTYLAHGVTVEQNGFFRVWMLARYGAGITTGQAFFTLAEADSDSNYDGIGTLGAYIWGAQLENVTGQAVQTVGEYVSTNVLSSPYHGAGVDGVKYLTTTLAGAPLSGKFLSEPARTNLLVRSQEFDNAAWTKARATISANVSTTTAPNGTNTADKLVEDTTVTNTHDIRAPNIANAGTTTYVMTLYAKAAERSWIYFEFMNYAAQSNRARCWFNIGTGVKGAGNTVGSGVTYVSHSTEAVGNGWYRCILIATVDASITGTVYFASLTTGDGVSNYTGDGTSGAYLWGAQLEAGNRASSYIPTVASAVTRAADSLSYPVTAYALQGGFSCTLIPTEAPATAAMFYAVGLFGATNADVIGIYTDAGTSDLSCYVRRAGASTLNLILGTVVAGTTYKVAISWAGTAVKASVNGGAVISGTASNMPTSLSSFNNSIDTVWNGQVSDVKVFTQALSDNTLRQLTT